MALTGDQIATAFKSAISGSTFKLDIAPLQIDLSDKFKMTQTYTTWLKHFDRLLAAHPNRTDADKTKILLINVGQTGAAYFDRATTHTVAIWTFPFHQNSVKKSDDFQDLTLAQYNLKKSYFY